MELVIVGHGPSLLGARQGRAIDAVEAVCRLKRGYLVMKEHPSDYGERMDFLCSTLKTWRQHHTLKMKEYWGYENFPYPGKDMNKIRDYYGKTTVVTEEQDVKYWLGEYRKRANVLSDYTSARGGMASRGDEPWFSTGMGAIIIACARHNPETVFLAGFDNLWAGSRERFRSVLRAPGHQYPPHAWDVENRMLKDIERIYGCKICPLPSRRSGRTAGTSTQKSA